MSLHGCAFTHAITLTDPGLGVGLPLIPFVLIASRTRIFDSVLPVLPVIFFCHTDPLHFTLPPSPQITLALLPYIRSFYNTVWQHCIACHEARWIKETTPKFALESAEEQQRQRQRQQQRQADANDAQQAGADVLEQNEWDVEVVLENNNLILQGSNVTSMILGALLWPSVAKIIGQSLTWLPAAWGVKKWLPTQLARNVAGGLMVVVLKVRVACSKLNSGCCDNAIHPGLYFSLLQIQARAEVPEPIRCGLPRSQCADERPAGWDRRLVPHIEESLLFLWELERRVFVLTCRGLFCARVSF